MLQVTSYKLQVASYKLQVASYKLQVTGYMLQVANCKLQLVKHTFFVVFICQKALFISIFYNRCVIVIVN